MSKITVLLIALVLASCASAPRMMMDHEKNSYGPPCCVTYGTQADTVQGTPADRPRGDI